MGKLIITKQSANEDVFFRTLELLYNAHLNNVAYITNEDYKKELINSFDRFNSDSDNSQLVKQSEQVRYFGFADYDFNKKCLKITKSGKAFFESYLNNDTHSMSWLITQAIVHHDFGRNNTATKSDSDIDPPKLLVKAILDLGGVSTNEFAILLHLTHDLNYNYKEAINIIKEDVQPQELLKENYNKYRDTKFPKLLCNLGYLHFNEKKYQIEDQIVSNYSDMFYTMSIYNSTVIHKEDTTHNTSTNVDYHILPYALGSYNLDDTHNRQPYLVKPPENYKYHRDSKLVITSLFLSNYKCSIDETHNTFITEKDTQYMEAHHIIPMMFQKDFNFNIDRLENLICICPLCHKAIHYGCQTVKIELLTLIYEKKAGELAKIGIDITLEELYQRYYS